MKYRSRKFMLAVFFAVSGALLATFGKLGPDFVGLAALVMGAYNYGNVKEKSIDPTG